MMKEKKDLVTPVKNDTSQQRAILSELKELAEEKKKKDLNAEDEEREHKDD